MLDLEQDVVDADLDVFRHQLVFEAFLGGAPNTPSIPRLDADKDIDGYSSGQ